MGRIESERRWHGPMGDLFMSVEVLDVRAFLTRAQRRNRAFFDALGSTSLGPRSDPRQ